MATGPQRARLDAALSGAHDTAIDDSAREWDTCTRHLWTISRALETASPAVKQEIGGQTGPAIDAAFARSSQGMTAKAEVLLKGADALRAAARAIQDGRQEQQALAGQPLSEPAPYRPPAGQPTQQDLHEEAQNRQAHADYAAAYAEQERRAKERADHMDRVFEHSTAVMKEIHGIPDKERTGDPDTGGTGGPAGAGGYTPPHASSGGPGPATGPHGGRPTGAHDPSGPHGPGAGAYDPGPGHGPAYVPGGGAPQGGGNPFEYTPGTGSGSVPIAPAGSNLSPTTGLGVAGAAAGGIGGGMLATGLAAGGIRPGGLTSIVSSPGTAASSVRGIGATARSGISGALGRSGTSNVGVSPSSAANRGGATARGSASGRGGRAGGGTAGAAGRRGKDDGKGRKHELYDVGEDWIDDEDAAPGVLD